MSQPALAASPVSAPALPERTFFSVLMTISFAHLLNDTLQALLPALYPLLKDNWSLTFAQLGLITLVFQCTASLLQPVIGFVTDRRPWPYSLALGMASSLTGLLLLSVARGFEMIAFSAALLGLGSSVFHPEASRVAHMAAGRGRGFAQSLFQVGGNAGSSLGPLLAALVVMPRGQGHVAWFGVLAGIGIVTLWRLGAWQARHLHLIHRPSVRAGAGGRSRLPRRTVVFSLAVIGVLVFSKYVYLASMTNYYTFYLMERFGIEARTSQLFLFIFLFAVAAGTIIGGPVGDRIGRKRVIWASILGVAPFSLWLPHAGLALTVVLSAVIGVVLASAFSAILVYAQELLPGRVGLVAGLLFGLAFGIAGLSAAGLGKAADHVGIITVFHWCAYLPLLGLCTALLPEVERKKAEA